MLTASTDSPVFLIVNQLAGLYTCTKATIASSFGRQPACEPPVTSLRPTESGAWCPAEDESFCMGNSFSKSSTINRKVLTRLTHFLSRLALLSLRFYRLLVSPLLPPSCRFMPTCSEYAIDAIRTHGLWCGSLLGLKRISRCHPFTTGGHDPVPCPLQRRHWFRSHTG